MGIKYQSYRECDVYELDGSDAKKLFAKIDDLDESSYNGDDIILLQPEYLGGFISEGMPAPATQRIYNIRGATVYMEFVLNEDLRSANLARVQVGTRDLTKRRKSIEILESMVGVRFPREVTRHQEA